MAHIAGDKFQAMAQGRGGDLKRGCSMLKPAGHSKKMNPPAP